MTEVSFSDDPGFDFAVRCALNGVAYRMAEVGEVITTGAGVAAGDIDGWFDAWTGRARALRTVAEACERDGRRASAAGAWLRSANYAFAGFWYVLGTSAPERAAGAWEDHRSAFEAAARLWHTPIEPLRVPFEGTELEGYLFTPAGSAQGPLPLVVIVNGLDTPVSDALMIGADDAVARGYAAVTVDGPGQGAALYRQGLTAREDYEAVLTALLDHVLPRPEIDAGRVALIGVSHGGYLGARGAAHEPRVGALVLDPAVSRVVDATLGQFPDAATAAFDAGDREGFAAALVADTSADVAFAAAKACEPFGAGATPYDALSGLARMELGDLAGRIRVPVMVCDPEQQEAWSGQAPEVVAALGGPVHLERFAAADGAGLDCEIMAPQVRNQRVFDWLDATLDIPATTQEAAR